MSALDFGPSRAWIDDDEPCSCDGSGWSVTGERCDNIDCDAEPEYSVDWSRPLRTADDHSPAMLVFTSAADRAPEPGFTRLIVHLRDGKFWEERWLHESGADQPGERPFLQNYLEAA